MTDAKRTKRVRENESLTLDEHIQQRRARLVSERAEVPHLRNQVEIMRDEAQTMSARWQVRRQRDLQRDAEKLEEECNIRENMSREHRFETMVVQYLQRYFSSKGPAWQVRRKSDSIQAYAEQSGVSAQHRASVLDEYLTDIDQAPAKVAMSTRDECPRCVNSSKPLLVCPTRSIMTCSECGYSVAYLDATSSSTAFDEMVEFSQYSYKRVNHYMMWLTLVQGKEAHIVSDDIINAVMNDLYERLNVCTTLDITQKRVRDSLRHLRLRRAYDHVAQITTRLSGRRPPRISVQVEEQLRNMFLQMQPAFHRQAPKSRTNFLSYSYVLYRCFQILGLHDMLEGITLLKGRDKLEANDAIFRRMCIDLGWPVFDLPPASETVG
tara:strand:+ start:22955 stop:24094 length:1140 start_codon:yes stop_codon:yes gene_type:complete